ncbi:hypothetical protein ACPPVT_07530 [Angustibacter sp. McL0619]|uniref:hypothetical protein n=1 Tax=Angustibacter sp. McL0619 TaxID=3415676 RepID=UPI003CE700DD
MGNTTVLTEAIKAGSAIAAETKGRLLVTLITPGVGSSGYYAAEVLQEAATSKVWPAGTHCYVNHPSESEMFDRPERSIDDLAAVLTEDARWDGTGLVAEAQVFPHHKHLTEMAGSIGMSIRAGAVVSEGEIEGRKMPIVDKLTEGISVDFVTHAGRGGTFEVLESARPTRVVQRAVARGVREATANDTREALGSALRERFTGDKTWVWVRDFDDAQVWFELQTETEDACYQLAYELDAAGTAVLSDDDPVEVRVHTEYVPVDPAGQSTTTQESEEDTMPQIEEARLRQLEEDAGRVQTLISERDAARTERDDAQRELAEARVQLNTDAAARVVREAADGAELQLNDLELAGLAANAPLAEDGRVDEAALRTRADEAIAKQKESRGAGTVRSFGQTTGADGEGELSEADLDKLIAGAFGNTVKEG